MKQIRYILIFLLCAVFLLGVGCAEREHSANSSDAFQVFWESSEAFTETSSGEASSAEETSTEESLPPASDPAEELLAYFTDLSAEDAEEVLSFFRFVGEIFGEESLSVLAAEIEENGYTDTLWREITGNSLHVLRSLYLNEPENTENVRFLNLGTAGSDKKTVMTFGGDICFADNYVVMQHLKTTKNGLADCLAPEWFDVMRSADIAMMNNEFTISDRGEPMAGKAFTFRAAPENTALYQELGIDFVTLANNHAFDFGKDAFLDMLDTLNDYGIDFAGGGRNAEEAQKPFFYLVDGRKIGFISATRAEKYILTPEAGSDSPGVFRCYDTERLLEVIAETKRNCDYVVLFVHWGAEGRHTLEEVQVTTAHEYIDAGADLIIGSHAHRLQGIEFYKGKAIFYNLGNFWFDSYDIETGLVKLELYADGSEDFYFLPGMQSGCETGYELGTPLGREILNHVESYLEGIRIEDNGLIREE